jgi:hypothetical protein
VANDGRSAMEQVLAKFGVDSIPFRFFFPDNISEHYGAELRLANEFQIIGGAYQFGGLICQPNRAADHGGEFFAAEGLKRDHNFKASKRRLVSREVVTRFGMPFSSWNSGLR